MFSAAIVAILLVGQVYFFRVTGRYLETALGRKRGLKIVLALRIFVCGMLAVVGLDNAFPDSQRFGLEGSWIRGVSYTAGIWVAGATGAAVLLICAALLRKKFQRAEEAQRADSNEMASRRLFLSRMARTTAALAPFGIAAYGTLLVRSNFELREVQFPAKNLPGALEGLRIALLTDIHFGPYLSLPELRRVVAMANEARPHLTVVTGDLITRTGDPLETCLTELAKLRAEAGVIGCLGNHEIYADCQEFAETRGRAVGIEFLRQRCKVLDFGGALLNVAGVDYQRQRRPYLVGAGDWVRPGAVNVLLSHNPDVFPVAADLGYDLVVGGHTHGGQVAVEILEQTLNVGRFFTPFVAGLYQRGNSSLYVSRGIGTINLPIRLGARPEVTLLVLRRA